MSAPGRWSLFEVFGVEIEYMIVDRDTLAARPIADELLKDMAGDYVQDIERDEFAWSNELVCHVIELKTNGPAASLAKLGQGFHDEIRFINTRLERHNAMVLGTGAHPLFQPANETRLWPHGDQEIYAAYDRIFGCQGHGWSNLQSVHLNLPFSDDREFGRLHAAIRLLLPIIPALSASTPVLDGRVSGIMDTRLETYRHNQKRIPSIVGSIIPERAFTQADYQEIIFDPIARDIAPHDPDGLLETVFLNSRGAIARFDRNAIEIRVIDTQEAPVADIAILDAVVAVLREFVSEKLASYDVQKQWPEDLLASMFMDVVRDGDAAIISDRDYLQMFGFKGKRTTAGKLWKHLAERVAPALNPAYLKAQRRIISDGPLARRLVVALGSNPTADQLRTTYAKLAGCLADNRQFP